VKQILIIEDNSDLAFGLRRTLEFEGYGVGVAEDGVAGLTKARAGAELVLLDLMLPGMDGFKVLRALRGEGSTVPVLVLTARGAEEDILRAFENGADDYVTKPFSTPELMARVRALLRRTASDGREATGVADGDGFGTIWVDLDARSVTRDSEPVQVTPKEFDLLVVLLRRRGGVVSRAELLEEVWQYRNTEVVTRTVDIHIAELRRKLERNPARPEHILTVRKAGYRLRR